MSGFDPMKGLTLFGEDRYVLVDDAGRIVITFDAVGDQLMATTVQNIDELAALNDVPLPNGAPIAMTNVRDFWTLERGSTEAPDGITIIATQSGIGNFHRACLPHNHWRGQMNWWMDSVNGDDENSGTVVTAPIKTFEEFRRRHGRLLTDHSQAPARKTLTILDTGDVVQNFLIDMKVRQYPEDFVINGSLTHDPLYSGSVTGYLPWNVGAQQEPELTDAALPVSWTASGLVHKQAILTSGPNAGATAYVSRDLAAKTALMPLWLDASGWNMVEPGIGDTFEVFAQTVIKGNVYVDIGEGFMYLNYIEIDQSAETSTYEVAVHSGYVSFVRCATKGTNNNRFHVRDGQTFLRGGMIASNYSMELTGGDVAILGTLITTDRIWCWAGVRVNIDQATFDGSGRIDIGRGTRVKIDGDTLFVNCGADAPFVFDPGGLLEASAIVWGTTGNAPQYAFLLGTMSTIVANAAALQIMGGTINDILLGSVGVAYGAARPMVDVASEAKVLDYYSP